MNGATTDPCESIINPPNINNTIIMGANHNFFLIRRNSQSSFINSILITNVGGKF